MIDRARQSGCEGKGHCQTISHSDDDIANDVTRGEVTFGVGSLGHAYRINTIFRIYKIPS
jgi:hypothetical protein